MIQYEDLQKKMIGKDFTKKDQCSNLQISDLALQFAQKVIIRDKRKFVQQFALK